MSEVNADGLLEGLSDDDKADVMAEVDSLTRIVNLTRLVEKMLLDIWCLRADVSSLSHIVEQHVQGLVYDPKYDPDEQCLREAREGLEETKHYGDFPKKFEDARDRLLRGVQ